MKNALTPFKHYIGPPGCQVNLTEIGVSRPGDLPLYCLHATAYSGRSFMPLMEALAGRRRVVAPDTPGYGNSDRPAVRPDLPGYAEALAATIRLAGETRVDLLGFHTGALVAAELARQAPDLVRRLILIGVPFFTGKAREDMRRRLAEPVTLTPQLEQFYERWAFFVTNRRRGQSMERAFENFVDELRAWPFGWWAHEAAFTFDAERYLPLVNQPALVLTPQNHLADSTRRAASVMPGARLVELPHLDHAIFDVASDELADRIDSFLREGRLNLIEPPSD